MSTIRGLNLSNQSTFVADGVNFIKCNMTQSTPFTKMNHKNCTFDDCNITNNEIDETKNTVNKNCNNIQCKREKQEDGTFKLTFYDKKTKEIVHVEENA